ncbi:hypothetical protein EJB05_29159, partial [Eragrostis curvula]
MTAEAGAVEDGGRTRPRPPPASEHDVDRQRHGRGKEKDAGASSSGAAGRSTTTAATVEVTTQRGAKIKLRGPISNPWSHGQPYMSGFTCKLDPEALYRSKLARKASAKLAVTLAIKKLASSSEKASIAIEQFAMFTSKRGLFGGEEARKAALSGRMRAADWWDSFGGQYQELQKIARRIVSQCMSSSGCERNWSTFALVHTKLRNRLGYDKLHKLVYVHYNLKLRIQHYEADLQSFQEMQNLQEREADPCSILMDVALYDEGNPIIDWFANSMSAKLSFDTEGTKKKRKEGSNKESNGKKKRKVGWEEEEEGSADDCVSDSSQGSLQSPTYVESGDGSSGDSEGDDDDGAAGSEEARDNGAIGKDDGVRPSATLQQPAPRRRKQKRQKTVSVKGLYSV